MNEFEGIEKGSHIVIAGSGGSVRDMKDEILAFVDEHDAKVMGINFMTSLCIPDYHLWTNKQRYRDLGQCVDAKSKFLFGRGLSDDLIRKHWDGDYTHIDYDDKAQDISYRDRKIYGPFRTAGILGIMVSHLMGAGRIDIVGMDGYTLHGKKELDKGEKNHHCYGEGYTDDNSWDRCVKKDDIVYQNLRDLKTYGVDFSILTPTVFEEFYSRNNL